VARILVVGGSLGGLMAANLLLRAGHEVQVLERSLRGLQGRGAGIVTHAGLRQALVAAGAVVDDSLGISVASRVVLGTDGQALCTWDYPQILTSWGRLYSLLRAALPALQHRLGAMVTSVAQDDSGVSVRLADGETVRADLLLAADGIRSTVRAQLLPSAQPQYAGYVAWRGVCDEALLSRFTRETLFPFFGFGLPQGEQLIGYPVAGADDGEASSTMPGQRRWNFVWYRPAAAGAELTALMTDADGRHHPEGIAPHQVAAQHIAELRDAARRLLAPQLAEVLEKTAQPFLQPIVDLLPPPLAHGRIALMGDAACVARPHVGMGVAKAADDAMALVHCIAQEGAGPAALARFDALRRPQAAAVVQRARRLGAYMEASQQAAPHSPAMPARRPEDVMQQTAIDPDLFDAFPAPALAA
jgi:2-polyprenyl-6-methoxyphenol hydroxylase-like FAD-dependent oxidoreductase